MIHTIMKESEAEMGYASPSYTCSSLRVGLKVEVARNEVGSTGAWYEATIVEHYTSKAQNKRWGYWVEYKNLLCDEDDTTPKREYIRRKSLLRPAPPIPVKVQLRSFRVNDVVDAFYLAGWWTGVIVSVVADNDACRFRVGFKDPDDVLEFSKSALRFHLDWADGNWVIPKMPLQLGSSSAAHDHPIKITACSNKKQEVSDTRTDVDVVQPLKKLRSRKHVVEELENQEPRPLVSEKEFTEKPRIVGSADNQSHAVEKHADCSPTEIAHSSGDCNRLTELEDVVDRELNEEDMRSWVDAGIVVLNVQSHKSTGDNDVKPSDCEFQIAEGSSERKYKDLSDHRSLAVPRGMEKQALEITLHDSVNEQNGTNQVELRINTLAGVSASAVQPCVGTSTRQPNGMPNAELNSITMPEPSFALPFKKNSTLWKLVECMQVFVKCPQNPHFSPLVQYEEEKREEVALLKMMEYALAVEKIPKLTLGEPNSSNLINDMLASFKELEGYGFDVMLIKHHLNNLLLNNEKQIHLQNKLENLQERIRNCNLEKAKAEMEVNKVAMLIKEVMSAKNVIETMDSHLMGLISEKAAIGDAIFDAQLAFDGTVASVKQLFS